MASCFLAMLKEYKSLEFKTLKYTRAREKHSGIDHLKYHRLHDKSMWCPRDPFQEANPLIITVLKNQLIQKGLVNIQIGAHHKIRQRG